MRIETPRLRLRPWEPRDAAPFAALNADPEVMRHFPEPLTRARSDLLIERLRERAARLGFCFSAAERRSDGAFLGMIGAARVELPGTPVEGAVELGWRLAREAWGQGYATEGARGAMDWAFETLGAPEVIAFTTTGNLPSQAVMRRLGMRPDPARAFDHPSIAEDSPLRRHVVFALAHADRSAR